jgi:hypothetical protein
LDLLLLLTPRLFREYYQIEKFVQFFFGIFFFFPVSF